MSRGNTGQNYICLSSSEPEKTEDAIIINRGCVYCSYLKVMYLVHNTIIQGISLQMIVFFPTHHLQKHKNYWGRGYVLKKTFNLLENFYLTFILKISHIPQTFSILK